MERLLLWLSARPRTAAAITTAYIAAVIASHELIQISVIWCYDRYGRGSVNRVVHICGVAAAVAFAIYVVRHLARPAKRGVKAAYLAITLGMMAASWPVFFYTDIEVVHFPQYAVLAVLIFARSGSFARTMFYVALVGAVDEAVQFYVVHPNWGINLDLNDMVYNALGGGLGCTLVYLAVEGRFEPSRRKGRLSGLARVTPVLIVLALVAGGVVLSRAGLFGLDPRPDGSRPRFVVRRNGPPRQFWHHTSWGKSYHELSPGEAGVIGLALFALYGGLDLSGRRRGSSESEY